MAALTVEVVGHHPGGVNVGFGDGSVRIVCQENLQDMVRAISSQTGMHSIGLLRITAPGIIAILIGLLLPAVEKVREAAARNSPLNFLPESNKTNDVVGKPGLGNLLSSGQKVKDLKTPGLGGLLPGGSPLAGGGPHLADALNFKPPAPFLSSGHSDDKGEILPFIESVVHALRPYFAPEAQVELRATKVAVHDIDPKALSELAKLFGVPILVGAAHGASASWQGPVTKATPNGAIQRL